MEDIVQKTELLVVEPFPNHCDCCRCADHGQEEDRSIYRNAFHLSVEQDCQEQSNDYGERNLDDGIFNGVPQGLPYFAVSKELLIVAESDKDITFTEITSLTEGLIDCLNDRVEVENNQADHGGQDESPSPHSFPLLSCGHAFLFPHTSPP